MGNIMIKIFTSTKPTQCIGRIEPNGRIYDNEEGGRYIGEIEPNGRVYDGLDAGKYAGRVDKEGYVYNAANNTNKIGYVDQHGNAFVYDHEGPVCRTEPVDIVGSAAVILLMRHFSFQLPAAPNQISGGDRDAQIKHALDRGDIDRARGLVRDALRANPTAETYYLAAQVALSPEQKRDFLSQALALDPFHTAAYAEQERTRQSDRKEVRQTGTTAPTSAPPATPLFQPASAPALETSTPKRGNNAGLIIGVAALIVVGAVVMNMLGFFGGKEAFEGSWIGTLPGGTVTCSDGSSAIRNADNIFFTVSARRDNAIEWYNPNTACTFVMDVNGNTATQRSGTSCRVLSDSLTTVVDDMRFVLNGSILNVSYSANSRSGGVTCTATFFGTAVRQQ